MLFFETQCSTTLLYAHESEKMEIIFAGSIGLSCWFCVAIKEFFFTSFCEWDIDHLYWSFHK